MNTLKSIAKNTPYRLYSFEERSDNKFLSCSFDNVGLLYDDQVLVFYAGQDILQPTSQLCIMTDGICRSQVRELNDAIDLIDIIGKNGDPITLLAHK